MKYYLDITLLPDAEANLGFLWQKVYQQVHLALVENKTADNDSEIAISLPEYGCSTFPLGSKIRLLSRKKEQLQKLEITKWLNRLTDYAHCTSIKEVPKSVSQFACFKRVQFDSNIERLVRRRMKRKEETFEQAMDYFAGFEDRKSKLPFVNMKSLSESQRFRLFIDRYVVGAACEGKFSCYGLSKGATVPLF